MKASTNDQYTKRRKQRNWVAQSLVAHRAAVHGKSNRAQRKYAKECLRASIVQSDDL